MRQERRSESRVPAVFPINDERCGIGETLNVSESGACLLLRKAHDPKEKVRLRIDLPFSAPFESEAEVIWTRRCPDDGAALCGVRLIEAKKKDLSTLKGSLLRYRLLNPEFIDLTKAMRSRLSGIKNILDMFDGAAKDEEERVRFIEKSKDEVYSTLTNSFSAAWNIVEGLNKEEYNTHQEYYQKMLWYMLRDFAETNQLVCRKPLGYSGDYMIMNYIYDFHNRYLGASSYEKLINSYTCSIPIAISVVRRKEFFSNKILETMRANSLARILSVASGPCRELMDILKQGKISKPLHFDCLDFEKEALEYVKREIESIEPDKRKNLHMRYINRNLLGLLRNNGTARDLANYDLIYASGLFDYLTDRIARRSVEALVKFLNPGANLIITNAAADSQDHRAYYEMLGEWYLIYRTREEMLGWTRNIRNVVDGKIINPNDKNSFLFLGVTRRTP